MKRFLTTMVLALMIAAVAQAAEPAKSLDQLLKDKAEVEKVLAGLAETFNKEREAFNALPETKAHNERVAAATKKLGDEFDKTPAAAAFVKKARELQAAAATSNQRLQQIKDQIVEAASRESRK